MTTFWTENSILNNQSDTTPPAEIFDAFCQAIGFYYQQKGYRYTKSRQRVRYEVKDLFVEIGFRSSRSNMAGSSVGLEVLLQVGSKKLKKWTKDHKAGRSEYICEPREYDFRTQNIYGTTVDFFLDLILKINQYVSTHFPIEDNKAFIDTLFDNNTDVINDNFACYLAMNNDPRLTAFMEAHADSIDSILYDKLKPKSGQGV
jgi:hypothetical protein